MMPLSNCDNSASVQMPKTHDMNLEDWYYSGNEPLLSAEYDEKQSQNFMLNMLPSVYFEANQAMGGGLARHDDKPHMSPAGAAINGSVRVGNTGMPYYQPNRKIATTTLLSPNDQFIHTSPIRSSGIEYSLHDLNTMLVTSLFQSQADSHKASTYCLTPEFSSSESASPDPSPQYYPFYDHSIPAGFLGAQEFSTNIANSKSNQFIHETDHFIQHLANENIKAEIPEPTTPQVSPKILIDALPGSIPNKIKFVHCNPSKGIHSSTSKALRYHPAILNEAKLGNLNDSNFSSLPFGVLNSDFDTHGTSYNNEKDKKAHLCPFCSRHFRRRHDLHRHIRLHTGERPYSCDICTKAFYRTDALKRHYRSEHKLSMPYKS
ncbi:hypothetical protein K7432_003228 [Basidiobolus ranarum]|uniref:C2H2-type domain-containing protein n=1 Tax=Basidiobolus ranarum TaxID=34480 RepID=A0ABR2X073_9FUNG